MIAKKHLQGIALWWSGSFSTPIWWSGSFSTPNAQSVDILSEPYTWWTFRIFFPARERGRGQSEAPGGGTFYRKSQEGEGSLGLVAGGAARGWEGVCGAFGGGGAKYFFFGAEMSTKYRVHTKGVVRQRRVLRRALETAFRGRKGSEKEGFLEGVLRSLVALHRAMRLRFGYGFELCDANGLRDVKSTNLAKHRPVFFPNFSLLVVRNWSWKCLNEGNFTLRFVWQFDAAIRVPKEPSERDGIAAKLLRCRIASEVLQRNVPLS